MEVSTLALTDKQELFVREYLVDLNASAAYLRAGYKCKPTTARVNACNLLTNPNIQKAIDKVQQKRVNKADLSAQWVLDRLTELTERCMQAEPVKDREGNPTGEYKFDSSGANKALESIGKHLGMFKDKVELTGDEGGPLKVTFNIPRPQR